MKSYLFRVVVPRRDFQRVEWLKDFLNSENVKVLYAKVDYLFGERSDLDAVEVAFILMAGPRARRELERRLAASLTGSLGFFVSSSYRKAGD